MSDITLKSGEAKWITFTVKDDEGNQVDLSSSSLTFYMKPKSANDLTLTITNSDFDKSQASLGIVRCYIGTTYTSVAGAYVGELKIVSSGTPTIINKTHENVNITILKSVS
jgi:hypothetical protein